MALETGPGACSGEREGEREGVGGLGEKNEDIQRLTNSLISQVYSVSTMAPFQTVTSVCKQPLYNYSHGNVTHTFTG